MSPPRTIAIGDIHGCAKALDALLDVMEPTADDLLITLGDYVDRGPDSCSVVDRLIELEQQCRLIPLIGNHEIIMLQTLATGASSDWDFWMHCGGEETIASYGGDRAGIPQGHLRWLEACRHFYETPAHLFVHANYNPDLPLADAPESLLLWQHVTENPAPHCSGKTVIVGHTPQMTGEILDLKHVICLDTFCYGNGWLSALEVNSGDVWQADKLGNLRFRAE